MCASLLFFCARVCVSERAPAGPKGREGKDEGRASQRDQNLNHRIFLTFRANWVKQPQRGEKEKREGKTRGDLKGSNKGMARERERKREKKGIWTAAGKPPESSAQTNHKIPSRATKPIQALDQGASLATVHVSMPSTAYVCVRVQSAHSLLFCACMSSCMCAPRD